METLIHPSRTSHLFYGRVEISRRIDGTYAVWVCVSAGDLDMISTREIKRAIEANEPHRNPLKWTVCCTTQSRDTAQQVEQCIRNGGLRSFLALRVGVGSLLRDWPITGDCG